MNHAQGQLNINARAQADMKAALATGIIKNETAQYWFSLCSDDISVKQFTDETIHLVMDVYVKINSCEIVNVS
jgi:hypothetical protein